MSFWIIITLMALAVAGLFALILMRGRDAASEPAAAYDLRVYRDQLKEIDRDLARGVIREDDAERIRTEVARRILAADEAVEKAARRGAASPAVTGIAALGLIALLIGGSLWLYRDLGAPGYSDLGLEDRIELAAQMRASRPGQVAAEAQAAPPLLPEEPTAEYLALIQQLRDTVAERPEDQKGQELLARHEAATGNFRAAYEAQAQVLRLKGEWITPGDLTDYADMLILAAGGYVSPEAETVLRETIRRDPENGVARYYWGLMLAQTGRPDQAFGIWKRLLDESEPGAPWIPAIRSQIEEAAARAGIRYALPPEGAAPPGPTADDVAAAQEMSAEDRQEMIRSMVQRLSDRLADEGGPPADWARLITALGVLGDTDQARAILAEARVTFAKDDAALAQIEGAAAQAGIAE